MTQPDHTEFLVKRAADGDAGAFDDLYARVAPSLYVWAHHRLCTSLRTDCEPEDILQEVWQRAFKALVTFDATRFTFRKWVFGVARHVVLNVLRDAGRQAGVQSAEGHTSRIAALAEVPDRATALTKRVAHDDTVRSLLAAIESLPPEDKELVVRCGLEAATCEEVGRRIGASAETVTKRWQRLRARLREMPRIAGLID